MCVTPIFASRTRNQTTETRTTLRLIAKSIPFRRIFETTATILTALASSRVEVDRRGPCVTRKGQVNNFNSKASACAPPNAHSTRPRTTGDNQCQLREVPLFLAFCGCSHTSHSVDPSWSMLSGVRGRDASVRQSCVCPASVSGSCPRHTPAATPDQMHLRKRSNPHTSCECPTRSKTQIPPSRAHTVSDLQTEKLQRSCHHGSLTKHC